MSLLEVRGLSKRYAAPALVGLDLDVRAGEVHALVGANGAGKSTLARIVSGLVLPDDGQMRLGGSNFAPRSKSQAEHAGVHIVQQELNILPTLTVAENLFLNRLPRRRGLIDYGRLHREARAALATVGLAHVDPRTPAGELGIGHRQLVEIATALARPCRLLVLDEPTAALTDTEIERLFARIRQLRRDGAAIVYISHRMDEIRRIADRVSVLRDGRLVETGAAADLSTERAIRLMTSTDPTDHTDHTDRHGGHHTGSGDLRGVGAASVRGTSSRTGRSAAAVLAVERLSRGDLVRDVSFEVHSGEILGVAGLVGSGRTELLRAIYGADRPDAGRVLIDGRVVNARQPRDSVRAGMGLVPEDRRHEALLLPHAVRINMTLARIDVAVRRYGWIDPRRERAAAATLQHRLDVRCVSTEQPVAELSGGNQQKVVVSRWMLRDCRVLLFDEPTRGIDIGAKQTVYRMLADLASEGKALVVVSSELQELFAICGRIAVLSAGRLVATFDRGEWTEDRILAAAFSEHVTSRARGGKTDGQV
jgi:ribose transport system ATP-binding protein